MQVWPLTSPQQEPGQRLAGTVHHLPHNFPSQDAPGPERNFWVVSASSELPTGHRSCVLNAAPVTADRKNSSREPVAASEALASTNLLPLPNSSPGGVCPFSSALEASYRKRG